ncbi:hypothetical protein KR093_001277 [Drosophila rubida]|uniref:Macoilin n=1 Tax=Drosophila rubida TaxID=30044 RepID=A0AAD4PK71_9MUSC|nr:hypothetical protein KR093_001277 [Drosophila rubida]
MKRRNADCGKLRRPMKRNKITEGMYGSTTVLYMKFLILWAIVMVADFMFMFRFEFLWPFWLLLRSVHDSFKYKGLAFSVLFVCIAITSDLVCLFFIPVHWLLFAASTYVWVQYVWHTDKGICLPTIILWMLFVYLEVGIRWKDSRHMPHLDLCRPFAAHCIGYPVVTLGFGFKSYVGYRMRQRKQREVAKENEFYMQLLQQALPAEETTDEAQAAGQTAAPVVATANSGTVVVVANGTSGGPAALAAASSASQAANGVLATATQAQNHHEHHHSGGAGAGSSTSNNSNHQHHHHHHSHNNNNNNNSSSSSQHNKDNNSSGGDNSTTTTGASSSSTAAASAAASSSSPASSASSTNTSGSTSAKQSNASSLAAAATTGAVSSNYHYSAILHTNHIKRLCYHLLQSETNKSLSCSLATRHNMNIHIFRFESNGHAGGGSRNHRRSMDKEKHRNKGDTADNEHNSGGNSRHAGGKNSNSSSSNSYNQADGNSTTTSNNSKEKSDWDSGSNANYQQQQQQGAKDKHGALNNKKVANAKQIDSVPLPIADKKTHNNAVSNGNVLQFEAEETAPAVEATPQVEKTSKGRRNRGKKDNAAKDNQSQQQAQHQQKESPAAAAASASNGNGNGNGSNINDASSVSSSASSTSSNATAAAISHIASKVVSKICETCLKLEADVKKYRAEISHMKQIENELRQKLDVNMTSKSSLQAKQKECDELEKRIQELNNSRHADMLSLQTVERRLNEERRQKQSLDSQLANEKKARKAAEEKAARPECSSQCKQRRQQIDEELKRVRNDLKQCEEANQVAVEHGRKFEQEYRLLEAKVRNRETTQADAEMLMNALASIQEKNATLEKNLSAETRVKLDLFSALGVAKRKLEISDSHRRSKEDEVIDLKAKIAQLLAVMPDTLCLNTGPHGPGGSMLRMNDTPPLQPGGPGPSSPMLSMSAAQEYQQHQQQQQQQHQQHQQQQHSHQQHQPHPHQQQQQQQQQQQPQQQQQQVVPVSQQQQQQMVPVSVAAALHVAAANVVNGGNGLSTLDPNASVYTPKTGNMMVVTPVGMNPNGADA